MQSRMESRHKQGWWWVSIIRDESEESKLVVWVCVREWYVGGWDEKDLRDYTATLSYATPLTCPPFNDDLTLIKNWSLFLRRSSAASVRFDNSYQQLVRLLYTRGYMPLFNGSSALGSKKRYCRPTMTELRFRTGFQSSRRIFRQTFPSRSTLGW